MDAFPSFELPHRLFILLLLPVLITLYILAMRRRGRGGMRFTNTSMLAAVMKPQPTSTRKTTRFARKVALR